MGSLQERVHLAGVRARAKSWSQEELSNFGSKKGWRQERQKGRSYNTGQDVRRTSEFFFFWAIREEAGGRRGSEQGVKCSGDTFQKATPVGPGVVGQGSALARNPTLALPLGGHGTLEKLHPLSGSHITHLYKKD